MFAPRLFALFLVYMLSTSKDNVNAEDLVIHLNNGDVRGEEMIDENNNTFYSFRGIPFAEPPVGNLRFKPPVPKLPWQNVLNATDDGPPCPQIDMFTFNFTGAEDNCLTLNVYTPMIPITGQETKLDVIVNIHGGGFLMGDGGSTFFYGPSRFMTKDKSIILVSFNYRVSTLGFLSTSDTASPGNYGLLDQVEALRWVRNNIDRFGGDPNKVTILGVSAGGASVIYQMLSPLTNGLFHRAVSMSGSALAPWALQHHPLHWAKTVAKRLDCPEEPTQMLVECLRGKTAQELVEAAPTFSEGLIYVPTVDNYFIMDKPYNIIKNKQHHDVPLMTGATRDDGTCMFLVMRKLNIKEKLNSSIADLFGCFLNYDKSIKLIVEKYFSNFQLMTEDQINEQFGQMTSDFMFIKNLYLTAKMMSDKNTGTYLYSYDFDGFAYIVQQFFNITHEVGVCHGQDAPMLFNGIFVPSIPKGNHSQVQEKLHHLVMSFAKDGIPENQQESVAWPSTRPNSTKIFHIDVSSSVSDYDETKDDLYDFWINQIPNALETPFSTQEELHEQTDKRK